MASRNSFLDSPSFRKIVTPTQREAISTRRRRSGFRGGSGGRSIRRISKREASLAEVQRALSRTGVKLSEADVKNVLAGKQVSQETLSKIQQQDLKNLQRRLSATGTRLSSQDINQLLEGRGITRETAKTISQAEQVSAARKQLQSQKKKGFSVEFEGKSIPVSKAFAGRVETLQEQSKKLNSAKGIVSEFDKETPNDQLFFEGVQRKIQRKQRSLTSTGFRRAVDELKLGIQEGAAGAGTVIEGAGRLAIGISPLGFLAEKTAGGDFEAKQQRVRSGVGSFAGGIAAGIVTRPRQTLFDISSPAAELQERARKGGLTERDLGLLAFDASTVAGPTTATKLGQRISAATAPLRKDFIPQTKFRARTTRATAQGVTTKEVTDTILPNVPLGEEITTLKVRGGVASTVEPLEEQVKRAGTTTPTATTAQRNLLPTGRRRGTIDLREPVDLDNVFFADPQENIRTSRLGLEDTGFGTDPLSGETTFTFGGTKPQVIALPNVKIEDFPVSLKRAIAKDPSLKSLTNAQRKELIDFQLRPRSDFTAPGFISPESEIVSSASRLEFERVGTTTVGGRRVPVFRGKTLLDDVPTGSPSAGSLDVTVPPPTRRRVVSPTTRVVDVTPFVSGSSLVGSRLASSFLSPRSSVSSRGSSLLKPVASPTSGLSTQSASSRSLLGASFSGVPSSFTSPTSKTTPPSIVNIPSSFTSPTSKTTPPSRIDTPFIRKSPPPRKRPDIDLDKNFLRESKSDKRKIKDAFQFRSSLVGIEIGQKQKTKKAKGFKGIEIRGI